MSLVRRSFLFLAPGDQDRTHSLRRQAPPTYGLSLDAAPLGLPLEKFTEQRLALLLGKVRNCGTLILQEGQKPATGDFRFRRILLPHTFQHLFRDAPASPAGNGRRKIDVTPFWMAWGLAKPVPLGEKGLGEPLQAPVAIGILRPVENREHRRHRNGLDVLA